jgi:hypothetical protein
MKRLTPNSHSMIKIAWVSLLASLVILAGCGGVSEDTVESANKAPVQALELIKLFRSCRMSYCLGEQVEILTPTIGFKDFFGSSEARHFEGF